MSALPVVQGRHVHVGSVLVRELNGSTLRLLAGKDRRLGRLPAVLFCVDSVLVALRVDHSKDLLPLAGHNGDACLRKGALLSVLGSLLSQLGIILDLLDALILDQERAGSHEVLQIFW
jgi:hypothetical protein